MGEFKQILIEAEKELSCCIDAWHESAERYSSVNEVRVEMMYGKPGAILGCYLNDGVTPNEFRRAILGEYGRGIDVRFNLLSPRTIEVFFPLNITKGEVA